MNRSRRLSGWPVIVGGVLLWLMMVLLTYYAVHKPLTSTQAAVLIDLIINLTLLVSTLVVAASWGNRIGRWLGVACEPDLEQWSLATTLGLGLLGTLILGLAVIGGLYRWVGYVLLLALGLGAVPDIRALWRWLASQVRSFSLKGISAPSRGSWLLIFTGVIGLLSLGQALLPPTAWDALVYHLQGPRLYVESHRLLAVPENFYLNWPAQFEMLFVWGLLLKGDILAQLFHWAAWLLTTALLYALARRTVDRRGAQWAVALWASVPLVSGSAGWAYIDLGLTALVLAAVYTLLRWTESEIDRRRSPSGGWLTLSAIFAGLAIATKYTAVTWLAGLLLLLVYHAWRHQHHTAGWIALHTISYSAVAGLMAAPWLVKSSVMTGNPFYPLLFGGAQWNPTREAWLTLSSQGYSRNLLDYLALPWLVTVLGVDGSAAFDATVGPLLLSLAPLALLFRQRPRAVNYAWVLVGIQWAFFVVVIYRYVFMAQTRMLLPAFPLLCLLAAFAIRCLATWDQPKFSLSWVIGAAVTLVLALSLLTQVNDFLSARPIPVLAGLESREDYTAERLGAYFAATRYMSPEGELPDTDTRFLFLWEPRGYYAPRLAQADPTLDNLAQLRLAHGSPDAALAELRAQGFTHLLFNRAGLEFLSSPTPHPPTLRSLMGQSSAEQSYYPITDEDRRFLQVLLSRSQLEESIGDNYEIYRLP